MTSSQSDTDTDDLYTPIHLYYIFIEYYFPLFLFSFLLFIPKNIEY